MTENREWLGNWAIDINGLDRIFYGVLTYSIKGGGELKIASQDAYMHDFRFLDQPKSIPIIKGYDYSSGKSIALINSVVVNYSMSAGIRITIHPNLIIENLEYTDSSSVKFLTATVEYAGLGAWLGITGVNRTVKDDGTHFTGISMEYQQPQSLKFDIDNLFKIEVHFGYSPGDAIAYKGYQLKETCYTSFSFDEPGIDVHTLMQWIEHYRRLFTILFGQPCFVTSFSTTNSTDVTLDSIFTVYYNNTIGGFPDKYPSFLKMRTRYVELTSPLGRMLKKWAQYHLSDDLDYVAWVASKTFRPFSEEAFLEVARSLEVFCGVTMDKNIYTETEKKRLKKAIQQKILLSDLLDSDNARLDSLDHKELFDNMIDKLMSAVNYSNSLSLRKKIKLAIAQVERGLDKTSFTKLFPDKDSLSDTVVSYRNYYTHYDKNSSKALRNKDLSIEQLFFLTRKVKNIVLLLLFDDLGMSMQHVANNFIRIQAN